ncbi:MAG: very short patch repair endonuclease [Treponema sp.]|jgi:DNA mismatch endonuclease (patch repair protein)|nr:very short patch repair endonuclease [Treponema sp.]
MDTVSPEKRSKIMSGIRSRNTMPEIIIRKGLFHQGFRYRINDKTVFGKPDIVLKKYHTAIFIHGCFWHGHAGCRNFKIPSSNSAFWTNKIDTNRKRDAEVLNYLHATGWRICIIWECAIRGKKQLSLLDDTINKIARWILSDEIWLEVTSESYNLSQEPFFPVPDRD